jgi:hypothetical protein
MTFCRFLAAIVVFAAAQTSIARTSFAQDYRYSVVASANNPGQSQDFVGLDPPAINNHGAVAFSGSYNCDRPVPCAGIWSADSGAAPRRTSTPNVTYFYYDSVQINDSDTISAEFFYIRPDTGLVDHIIEGKSGNLHPVTSLATYRRFVSPQLLENGNVAFRDGDTGGYAILAGRRIDQLGSTTCKYDQGVDASPNGFVVFLGSKLVGGECLGPDTIYVTSVKSGLQPFLIGRNRYGKFTAVGVNNSETIVFAGRDLPNRPGHVAGLFRYPVTGPLTALSEIDNGACGETPPADVTCQWRDYSWPLAVNARGVVAATIEIVDWKNGKSDDGRTGVAVNGDIDAGRVAWPGMTIGDCPVEDAFAGRRSINDAGQIAVRLTCRTHAASWTEIVIASPAK